MAEKRRNELNDLNGSQWLYFTNTLHITSIPPDETHALRRQHGAIKPPQLMAELIEFFTKHGQLVLDPFAGVGSTLIGASLCGRRALGFELNPQWVKLYRDIQNAYAVSEGCLVKKGRGEDIQKLDNPMLLGNCLKMLGAVPAGSVDAVISDPPYGCQHSTATFKQETNFNMFSSHDDDFGNSPTFDAYLEKMLVLGREIYRILRPKKYCVLIIGDRYKNSEYIPLGFMVAEQFRKAGFQFKGVKIWSNKATQRPLRPYAVPVSFVPNITHQNIVILKKA